MKRLYRVEIMFEGLNYWEYIVDKIGCTMLFSKSEARGVARYLLECPRVGFPAKCTRIMQDE